jgi:ABC-type glycerol-3-phosphate transport system permease component
MAAIAPSARRPRAGTVALYLVLLLGAIVMLTPLLQMILTSFKTSGEALRVPPTLLPDRPTLDAYRTVLTEAPFGLWFRNSVIVAVSVTALILFTSSLAGYVFAKFKFPGRDLLFTLLLGTLMVPFPVVLIPIYLIVNKLHLLNTLFALIVPSTVSAFGIFLMRQFISAIPDDLIDAARLDGASEFGIYWQLIRPQLGPAMGALGIFTFLASWNDYLWPLIAINDQDRMTLPLALAFFNSSHATRYDLVMAAAVLIVLPVIAAFLFFQRQFINALVLSGMKG